MYVITFGFMKKYPFLKEQLPMKEIASFIGISGEALNRIRKRLLSKKCQSEGLEK